MSQHGSYFRPTRPCNTSSTHSRLSTGCSSSSACGLTVPGSSGLSLVRAFKSPSTFFSLELKTWLRKLKLFSLLKNSLEESWNEAKITFFFVSHRKKNSFRNFSSRGKILSWCCKGQKGFELDGSAGNDILDCRPKTRLSDFVWDTSTLRNTLC